MTRRVVISGVGPVTGLGLGIGPTWEAAIAGRCAIGPIRAFDPGGFDCKIAAEVNDFDVRQFVPKTYRKATKVMARDIELAVGAADLAARDARLITRGTDPDAAKADGFTPSYAPPRVGCHIGAGLIAAELNELTAAMAEARVAEGPGAGDFDIKKWGSEGINHLTPLWLLKYLPNMLASHVTIIHDTQGPSNSITCGEASAGLSIGESLRVIQRGQADACFCGGAESKVNPMAFLRQLMTQRLNTTSNDAPAKAVRPFCQTAAGTVIGEGGGIIILEALETFQTRAAAGEGERPRAYAEVVGFGASQSVNPARRNLAPEPNGRGIAVAIRSALREAGIEPRNIDLIVPIGLGTSESDQAEAAALRTVFGEALGDIPVASMKSMAGNCGAGAAGLDIAVTAKALAEQTIPARINCKEPLPGLNVGTAASRQAELNYALTFSGGMGGQNAAMILKRVDR
jgi:3-oxoacyl-[acyl-carrier-protein] synthase II